MSGRSQRRVSPFVTNPVSCLALGHHLTLPTAEFLRNQATGRPTTNLGKKSARDTTLAGARSAISVSSRTPAGSLGVTASTQPEGVPNRHPEQGRTPLRHSQFGRELAHHPNKAWVSWLLQSINKGVSLGYTGPRGPRTTPNLPSAHLHPDIVTAELQKECAAGRVIGPSSVPPLANLKCSGVGVVPKKNGKWRMIHHLSAPQGNSINDFIPREQYSLHYATIDDAVASLLKLGVGALMAKVDLRSAFRMIPVRQEDWELLGIHWQNQYYVDTCLPFGLRSAPYLFNQFADALHWTLHTNHDIPHLIHYLDDYLLMDEPASPRCARGVRTFLKVCDTLGVPVALDKLEGPSTSLTFLGLELDSCSQEIRLPCSKIVDITAELERWSGAQKTTKRKLLSLIGVLSFAARAVPAGRLFLRRLITLSTKAQRLHHHIRLNREALADINWWKTFLPTWNGRAFFIDPLGVTAHDLDLYTDASGSLGCGAYYQGQWFHHQWQPHQQLSKTISIQWQELFAIVAAALTWGHLWSRLKIRFFCDNLPIVQAWEGKTSRQPRIMSLLRLLFLTAAKGNFTVTLKHIAGIKNPIADAISRQKFELFFSLAPQAHRTPTPTPGMINEL